MQQRSCFLLSRAAVPFGILCGWNDAAALYMLRQFPFVQVCYHTSVRSSQVCVHRLWSSSRAGTAQPVKWMGCGLVNPESGVRTPRGAQIYYSLNPSVQIGLVSRPASGAEGRGICLSGVIWLGRETWTAYRHLVWRLRIRGTAAPLIFPCGLMQN
jgi:hypothetical protein